MFDCSWVDPSVETVGQRKNRKEHSTTVSRRSSMHSSQSESTESPRTIAKAKPSFLNLFGGVKTPSLHRIGSHSKLSSLKTPDAAKESRRISSYTVTSDISCQDFSTTLSSPYPANGLFTGGPIHADAHSTPSEVSESVFSGRTGRSNKSESTWSSVESTTSGRVHQPLSPTSFVTQTTEITLSPRDSEKAVEQVARVVRISSAGTIPIHIHESPTRSSPPAATFDFPIPIIKLPTRTSSVASRSSQASGHTAGARGRQPDPWRPPETWDVLEDEDVLPKLTLPRLNELPSLPLRPAKEKPRDASQSSQKRHRSPPAEIQLLRRNIRKMDAASQKIVLERLKEEWVGVADASVYRELELEKQLWMLSALRCLKQTKSGEAAEIKTHVPASGISKILSLYENHASSSVLSALTTANQVHHLSTSPLSPRFYPNIHPLCVPGPTSQLPYASNFFTSIHAFALPSLLPAASLPLLLKECHRTLISAPSPPSPTASSFSSTATIVPTKPDVKGGILHLTILDPSPLPATLGPRLRAWLDSHLILNLERQFRCINPSRLFPIWLTDAGLRADGSTIVNARFFASASSTLVARAEDLDAGEITKQELKSVVGRMLWKEMWGGYVEGDKWWWDDESIVEECERMGTCWEYAVIEAVKEG